MVGEYIPYNTQSGKIFGAEDFAVEWEPCPFFLPNGEEDRSKDLLGDPLVALICGRKGNWTRFINHLGKK
jgi:hypothetical protein